MNSTTKWDSVGDVRKIAGLNFIINEGGKSFYLKKINGELIKLVEMMK